MSCGLSRGFQVTQNDLWELQECLQTPRSQKKPISALEGARQPVGSSFGPLRNVFTQPRPIADLGRTRLDRRRPPFHDAELSRYDAAFWAWEACVKRREFIAWSAEQRRGPPTLLAR